MEHFDVLFVGAGLSGVGAAARLKMSCPQKTFLILEVRSDSDMFTLGYRFRPWTDPKAIAGSRV